MLDHPASPAEDGAASSTSGARAAVPATLLLALTVADWEASSTGGATSSAPTPTALVDLAIGPTGGRAGILTASMYGPSGDITRGNGVLVVVMVHSGGAIDSRDSASVVRIDGTRLGRPGGTDRDVCISIPGVANAVLVRGRASGGGAGTAGSATVLTVVSGGNGIAPGVRIDAGAGGTCLTATPNDGTPPATGAAGASAGTGGPSTPNTGLALGLGGLLVLAGGSGLLGVCLRRS